MGISTCLGVWLGLCGKSAATPVVDALAGLAADAPALAGLAGDAAGAELDALAVGLEELEFAVLMEKVFHQKKVKQKQDSNSCESRTETLRPVFDGKRFT
jgi:hypothetical protein